MLEQIKKDDYEMIKNLPVAKFYYKGHHSHPVRRTIILIDSNKEFIKGYELREGSLVREMHDAPIKTFSRNKIAKFKNLRKDSKLLKKKKLNNTTLIRKGLMDLIRTGV